MTFRRVWIAFAILTVLVIGTGAAGFLWLRTSLPVTSGRVALDGLDAPVSIIRDGNAVPHIFAENERDAYFALGYTHAQDRLWQMEFLRRLASGRLAEVLGEKALATDKYLRTLGLAPLVDATFERVSPEVRAILDAYAAGVNAWLTTRGGALPPEFIVLRYEPEPWRPADPLLWSRLMAIRLGRNRGLERARLSVAQALAAKGLPSELIEDIWPPPPNGGPITVAGIGTASASFPDSGLTTDSGSNGWIVHGRRTDTGKPILANDPHLRFGAPILWYLAHIETPKLRLTGVTVPGVPFMLLGHNGAIAWSMTNGGGDVEDHFLETVDPDDRDNYLTPEGPRPFSSRREIIRVRDRAPVEIVVRETRHGPVISDRAGAATDASTVISLATPALRDDDNTIEAILALNRARNWRDFQAAAEKFHTPHTNLFFASSGGDIGFVSSGRIPLRKAGDGRAPVAGADGRHDWTGFIPMAELPRIHNPPSGRIVNANNRIAGDEYPYPITRDWSPPYRAQRIAEVLEMQKTHGVNDSQALQRDIVSTAARRVLPLMLAATAPRDARARQALEMLSKWGYAMRRGRPEPLIYAAWLRRLGQALIADEIGGPPMRAPQGLVNNPGPGFVALVLGQRRRWCDDINTSAPESCEDRLALSLGLALDDIGEKLGADMRAWRWGEMHRATFAHRLLTNVPIVAWFADLAIESDGGDHTINRGSSAFASFAHVDGAGHRAVYDLANLENSRFMIATGQSGNPLSPRYGNFLTRWRDGEYIRIPGGRDAVSGANNAVLELHPR